ncbi:hypothetical protein [Dyadobacter arcticus]|uniref:Uncharacterized protein with PQ loop repeat n=1 Tax=Dyadobacter arcticus TaxID=1078754 RepID=A0ABX0UHT9_9BACT|nr:hypothetical protein [Dyadobacter arcticus]NIJ52592.1 uncharacterized protein with PQ loop repeat [Dyadobacter arcticus]
MNKAKSARNILFCLLGFLGLGALGGGGVLIISPTGELMGMPLSMLDPSPFHSFLIPGILLFVVLGIFPSLLVFAFIKNTKSRIAERLNFFGDMTWQWSCCIYVAFALIIWIQSEMVLLHAVHWLHTVYMLYAVAILFVALLPAVRMQCRKQLATTN